MVSMGGKITARIDPYSNRTQNIHSFCGHLFCKNCSAQFLTTSIRDGKAYDALKCPEEGCGLIVSPLIVGELCDVQTRDLYRGVGSQKTNIQRSPLGRYCPHCNEFVERADNKKRKVKCPACTKSFCAKCSSPYHSMTSCNDMSFQVWSTFKNVKRCPRCDNMIEKNGGCQHMSCSRCFHSFCWTCMRDTNDCNSTFCKANLMNHAIFGQSAPVAFTIRGLAGAVALPVALPLAVVAGTAFVTYKSGKYLKNKYRRRQHRHLRKNRPVLRQAPSGHGFGLTAGFESQWRAETFGCKNKTISECVHAKVKRLFIPVENDLEISLVYLKRRLQSLSEQVSTTAATFKFALFFLKELKACCEIFQSLSAKKCNRNECWQNITEVEETLCTSIASLMLQLVSTWSKFCVEPFIFDCNDDDAALNAIKKFSYDPITKTYTIKNDATDLWPDVQELLPKYIRNLSKNRQERVLLHILKESGPNPSTYLVQIAVERLSSFTHKCVGKLIMEWFKGIRHSVEGDPLEWLTNKSWLQKLLFGPAALVQDLARYCIGAIVYHFQDITGRCKIGQNDQIREVDLFDIEDIVQDRDLILPTVSDFEHAQERPFATACMLQYLTSRQTPSLSLKMEVALSPSAKLDARFKEEDVLGSLYCAMMIIYDSSLASFLRGMCFRYLQLVFEMIGFGHVTTSTREEHENSPSWRRLIVKVIEACLAVMLHQTGSSHKPLPDRYMLLTACGCFHAIFRHAEAVMHLTSEGARKEMRKLVGGIIDVSQLRTLHQSVNRIGCKPSWNGDEKLAIFQALPWIAQMYTGQQWFLIQKKDVVTFYVSFDGEALQTTRPENCTVAWNAPLPLDQHYWLQEDRWVNLRFPMLSHPPVPRHCY
jgi:hypothetical protein